MTEARIGRPLAACLHQAIADQLPLRLEFYEHWLNSEGLREGHIGLAAITAVLGFLRTEGPAYDAVMARAGTLAAEWSVAALPQLRRRLVVWLPRWLRSRAALSVSADIIHAVSTMTRATAKVRRNNARVEVHSSLFCAVRQAHVTPLCGFYVALVVETLRQLGVSAEGRVESCRAAGGAACVLALDLSAARAAVPAIAA